MLSSIRTPSFVLLLSFLLAGVALALPAETTTTASVESAASATASASYNVFSAIASSSPSNGATGSTDDPDNPTDANDAGASGTDTDSINLSTGAIVAIATVAGAAVVIGISSAILFYLAKKRQWELREKLRRSARKVAAAITPRRDTFARGDGPFKSPKVARFPSSSRREKRGMVRIDPPPQSTRRSMLAAATQNSRIQRTAPTDNSGSSRGSSQESNMEKGFGTHTKIEAVKHDNIHNSAVAGTPPKSTFDMDSPVEEKKPWSKIFGKAR